MDVSKPFYYFRVGLTKVIDLNNVWLKSMDHVIYSDDVVEVTKVKFSSLKPHEAVNAEVIDVWASYLNDMEVLKSTQKPNRLSVAIALCSLK